MKRPEVVAAKVFGSRAKGTITPISDVDLALWGDMDRLRVESLAGEQDELPLVYRFDVKPFGFVRLQALERAH